MKQRRSWYSLPFVGIGITAIIVAGILLHTMTAAAGSASHATSTRQSLATSAPTATVPIPTTPTLPPLPTVAASCPSPTETFTQVPDSEGIAVNLGISANGPIVGRQDGIATGAAHGNYVYTASVGKITAPASMSGEGFIIVTAAPADPCKTDLELQQGQAPSLPNVNFQHLNLPGGVIITGITGDTLSYRLTTGATGHYDMATDQFSA